MAEEQVDGEGLDPRVTRKWRRGQWEAFRLGLERGRQQAAPLAKQDGPDRLLRVGEVMERTGLSRATLWRLERSGDFPGRVRLTGSTIAWRASEVAAWIDRRGRVRERLN